jgi:hypothetical protein
VRRCVLPALCVVAVLLLTGCGQSSSAAPSAVTTALSYFSSATPVAKALEKSEPDFTLVKADLFSLLARAGVNYNQDVKPLFGNPIAFGLGTPVSAGTAPSFLLAWQTKSATALSHLAGDLHGVTKTSTRDGATLYSIKEVAFAVDGPLLLVARSPTNLIAALERHRAGGGFTAAEYASDMTGLPHSALQVAGDLQSVLDTPRTAQARKIPWVAALTGYGVSVGGTANSGTLRFRVNTSGHPLSPSQLPIASGDQAPSLALSGGIPISFGLRDPAQVWSFIQGAERAADPSAAAKLLAQERTARRRSGVDIDGFLSSLTGDVQVASDGTRTLARISVSPTTVASWEKLLAHPGDGTRSDPLGGGFYGLRESGTTTLTAGSVGDELLLGKATPAQLMRFSHVASTPSRSTGAVAFKISLSDLIKLALARAGNTNPLAAQLTSAFGALTGALQASPEALTGSATVQIHLPGQPTS